MTSKMRGAGGGPGRLQTAVAFAAFLLAVSALCLLPPGRRARAHDGAKGPLLLEVGGALKADRAPAAPSGLKVVSYNIRYRVGDDLKQLIKLLQLSSMQSKKKKLKLEMQKYFLKALVLVEKLHSKLLPQLKMNGVLKE